MIQNYITKLLETMPKKIFNEEKVMNIDLIVEGGAFNGSYVVGILYFLKEMEKKKMIKMHRFSACSISTICCLLYIIDRLDLFEEIYRRGLDIFKREGRLEVLNDIFEIINSVTDDNLYKSLQNRLFITYYDVKYCKQVIRCKYKSNKDVFECISRSAHIPFIIDKNIARHGRYIDGQQPYFFKDKKNRKMLCISLVNYTNIGTLTSTINVKHETNNIHRVIGGTLDIHSFFMTGIPTQMCCFKDSMPLVTMAQNKAKQILIVVFGYIISIILQLTKNIGSDIFTSFAGKASRIVVEDIYTLFIQHYCV